MATAIPPRLHIVDITTPLAATFPADANFDRVSDVILRSIDLPAAVQTQTVRAVAVQGDFAYVLTNDQGNALGTLQVVRIRDPATAQVVHSLTLPVPRPTGLVVAGEVAYVPAGTAGLLVFDLRDPARPVLVTTLGDPDPTDAVATEFASGLALAGDFAYVVETHRQRDTGAQDERFTVLDLRDPLAPRRRGAVSLPVVTRSASSTLGTVRGRAHRGRRLCLPGARHPGAPGGRYPPSRCAPAGRAPPHPEPGPAGHRGGRPPLCPRPRHHPAGGPGPGRGPHRYGWRWRHRFLRCLPDRPARDPGHRPGWPGGHRRPG